MTSGRTRTVAPPAGQNALRPAAGRLIIGGMPVHVRAYQPSDERCWLRCRVLSFLGSAYFDDVLIAKPAMPGGAELVAVDADDLVGVLDLSVAGQLATIETIAVDPDRQRRGIGTALLDAAVQAAVAAGATEIDAYTRDDEQALQWYSASGFEQGEHYLHVYANAYTEAGEPDRAVRRRAGLQPIAVFLHADLEREDDMRRQFARVHVCRRFARPL